MVAFKAAQVQRFLAKPGAQIRAFLLYGPEPGLVADRAAALARALSGRGEPTGEIIRFDERDLAEDPDRLVVEIETLPMFGGEKVVRAKAGPRLDPGRLAELIAAKAPALIVVEAGNLRPTAKLRKVFEEDPAAAALPCYSDAARDMGPLIDAELARRGATITLEAKTTLLALVGSDPAQARAEIEKLALYVGNAQPITPQDVEAVVADGGEIALDALALAAAEGAREETLRALDRIAASGQSLQGGLAALVRHFDRLHLLAAEIEAGTAPARAVAAIRPPLGFKQRDALMRQARRWSRAGAERAILALQAATAEARRRPRLERQIAERLLLDLCENK